MNTLSVIVPCFNEEAVLEKSSAIIRDKMKSLADAGKISSDSFILLIDDGSTDRTWDIISQLCHDDKTFCGLKLSCNNGHQNALLAGLRFVADKCEACISIDADLQDDINAMGSMIDKFHEGYEIIYGVRNSRKTDNFLKRWSAAFFYWFMSLLGTKTIPNHADFRLMSRKSIEALMQYKEKNIFLRGIIPSMGFRNCCVYYDRQKRIAGKSKFSLAKMINLAIFGITSFSTRPLRLIFLVGAISFLISIASFIYVLWSYLGGESVKGWTSLIASVWFLGSIIIMSIGIIGEYIGRIYSEVKNRPPYNVESVIYQKND
ncbi:MAG: glycosyltransferase family 2 protein [Bacteroidales bacterium]|nr:glycosyltransferase family 2 protein [Bacteroidales bacterium]